MNPNVKKIVIVLVICAIILGLVLGLVFFFKKKKKNGGGTPPPGPMIGLIYKPIPKICTLCGNTTPPTQPPCKDTGAGVFYNVSPLPKTLNEVLPKGLTSATFPQLQTLKTALLKKGIIQSFAFPSSMIAVPNSNTVQLINDDLVEYKGADPHTPVIPVVDEGGQKCFASQLGSYVWVVGPSNAFKPSNLVPFAVKHPFLYPLVSQ